MPGVNAIAMVRWFDILKDGRELIEEYAAECADPIFGEVKPAAEIYAAAEKAGLLQCLGVYADNRLAGFATVMSSVLPHHGVQVALVESLFVSARYRAGGFGTDLLRAIEDYARESGADGVLYSVRPDSRLERLFEMKNYPRVGATFYRGV